MRANDARNSAHRFARKVTDDALLILDKINKRFSESFLKNGRRDINAINSQDSEAINWNKRQRCEAPKPAPQTTIHHVLPEFDPYFEPEQEPEPIVDQDTYQKILEHIPTDKKFNIVDDAQELYRRLESNDKPKDYASPIYKDSPYNKSEVAEKLHALLIEHNLKENFADSLMSLLATIFPSTRGFNLPVRISTGNKAFKSDIDPYIDNHSEETHIQYHVCRKGCVVYAGENGHLTECPMCSTPRYTEDLSRKHG